MLVLSRFKDEEVVVVVGGVELGRVAVVDIRGDKVRLGFKFPIEVRVDRLEVHEERVSEAASLAMIAEGGR